MVEGHADILIEGGKVKTQRLKKELITIAQLEAAARKQGFDSLSDVDQCVLEPGGTISFIGKRPGTDESRHREMMKRMDQLMTQIDCRAPRPADCGRARRQAGRARTPPSAAPRDRDCSGCQGAAERRRRVPRVRSPAPLSGGCGRFAVRQHTGQVWRQRRRQWRCHGRLGPLTATRGSRRRCGWRRNRRRIAQHAW